VAGGGGGYVLSVGVNGPIGRPLASAGPSAQIASLHEYNRVRDIASYLMGCVAHVTGETVRDVCDRCPEDPPPQNSLSSSAVATGFPASPRPPPSPFSSLSVLVSVVTSGGHRVSLEGSPTKRMFEC